jgi:hypothetical protein
MSIFDKRLGVGFLWRNSLAFRDGTRLVFFDDRTGPAGLKFVPEPLLSLDGDKWCRELEIGAAYIFSGRHSWDRVMTDRSSVPVPSLLASIGIKYDLIECALLYKSVYIRPSLQLSLCGHSGFEIDRPCWFFSFWKNTSTKSILWLHQQLFSYTFLYLYQFRNSFIKSRPSQIV